ncbi:MAG: hypothetical protein ABI378_13495 [Chitinophagaceae bacterium]
MKKTTTIIVLSALCCFLACTKQSGTVSPNATPATSGFSTHARLSGTNYSKSISVDTANYMIQSYLTGVGYPSADTSIRALSFDADTLRSYLSNPSITTIKFMIAHQSSFINAGGYGTKPGLNPEAIILIIVGLNDNNQYVLNSQSGVYDHMAPCPLQCPGNSSSLIQ